MDPHRPRKRFGQNFLHDPGTVERILRAIDPAPGDRVVEIGPGLGALTVPLLTTLGELDVVELDRDLIPRLETRCSEHGRLRVHCADALKFDFCGLSPQAGSLRVVGNLPYNISTPLVFHLIDQGACVRDMHFMLQKEVVQRMAAQPGSGIYGRLSVMVQLHCRVASLFDIGPGAFQPAPKVQSSFVRLVPHTQPPVDVGDEKLFAQVVTHAFGQRRKTLRNALKGFVEAEAIQAAGIDPKLRAESLTLEQFAALSRAAQHRR